MVDVFITFVVVIRYVLLHFLSFKEFIEKLDSFQGVIVDFFNVTFLPVATLIEPMIKNLWPKTIKDNAFF